MGSITEVEQKLRDTSLSPEPVHTWNGEVDLNDTVDTDVTTKELPAVVHEHVKNEVHYVEQEMISRDIHVYDVYHRVLPVIDTQYLPAKHYIEGTLPDGKRRLVELPPGCFEGFPKELLPTKDRVLVSSAFYTTVGSDQRESSSRSRTMKEAHVHEDTSVTIEDVPIPEITHPSQIIIKVVVAGCNPKDWKQPAGILKTMHVHENSGDDIAGIVHAVGANVVDFHVGDHVAALHEIGSPHGAFAEYAIAYDWTTFQIGKEVSFEDAATVPMISLMAAMGLFGMLGIVPGLWSPQKEPTQGRSQQDTPPKRSRSFRDKLHDKLHIQSLSRRSSRSSRDGGLTPSAPSSPRASQITTPTARNSSKPLLIYGASSGVGSMAVKLAALMNIHPLICVAGAGGSLVESLIDARKGDVVLDYRKGDSALLEGIQKALAGQKLEYAFDAISGKETHETIGKVLDPETGKLTSVLTGHKQSMSSGIEQSVTMAGSLWRELKPIKAGTDEGVLGLGSGGDIFGLAYSRLIGKWLREGKLKPHPYQVATGGLAGLEGALKILKKDGNSAMKYVVRIAETPGVPK